MLKEWGKVADKILNICLIIIGLIICLVGVPFVFHLNIKTAMVGLSLVAGGVYLMYFGWDNYNQSGER